MSMILLLEDEENVNRGIAFALEKEGYTVCSCFSLKEAERNFRQTSPELIICDITLPDGNGLDFVRLVREKSDAYIICLTALEQEMDQVMGYEAGADDYITKPFSLSILLLKVNAYMKRKTETDVSADFLYSEDIVFDRREMKAQKAGEELELTKNEWRLLALFLENPKQILSKNQLLEQLFDKEKNFVDENTIAVNIRRLREKIEPDAANPSYIKNIRGLGYIWDKECSRHSIKD